MIKDCPIHGHFEDVMAMDPAFFKHLEECSRAATSARTPTRSCTTTATDHQVRPRLGADDRPDQPLQHDVRPVLHGRQPGRLRPRADAGKKSRRCWTTPSRSSRSVRCRSSSPAASRRCRRTSWTRSATRKKVGYNSVQAATNGIEFAKSKEFAQAAAEAGLRYAYLQFDGIGNAANSHRLVGNLFDVKLRAIENLWTAGVDIVPVITIVNGVNNKQVGRVIQFALDNPKEDQLPVVPAGVVHGPRRGSDAGTARGAALHAVAPGARHEEPTGIGEPTRDWFPISFIGTFTDWADLVHGPTSERQSTRMSRARRTTSLSAKTCTCRVLSLARTSSTTPRSSVSASVTTTTTSHSTSRRLSSAPALKNVVGRHAEPLRRGTPLGDGLDVEQRAVVDVLVVVEPPRVPQPSENVGEVVVDPPRAPTAVGALTRMRPVRTAAANASTTAGRAA